MEYKRREQLKELIRIREDIKGKEKLQQKLEQELHNQNTELRKLQKKLYEKLHKQNTEIEIGELPLQQQQQQQRIAHKLVEEQEQFEGQFKRQGRSIKEQQELTEIYEKLLKEEREREREQFVDEKQLNKEILNFIEYIYRLKDTFIRSFDRYSQYLKSVGEPDVSEIELLKDFLEKVWLNDYDKNLTYYFETYKNEELTENIIDFVDLQCSPEFVQRYILIYEEFKEIRLNERLHYFEKFSEKFCKNKKEDTKETKERLFINFADLQKKRKGEDIAFFLQLIYDDRQRLIDEFNLIKSTTKMNYFEYILRILINTFNSYKLVVNSALSWEKKLDFSVLKKINCVPKYNRNPGFCLDEIEVYYDINNLIDKFNKLYKEYKKIRYSTTKDSEEFEKIIINLITIFVDLQEKINKSKHFDISAKQEDIIKMATQMMHTKQGGNPSKYKSTGLTVYILYKNIKYKRNIYMKDKRKSKYCKIDGKYILLSKLKVLKKTIKNI